MRHRYSTIYYIVFTALIVIAYSMPMVNAEEQSVVKYNPILKGEYVVYNFTGVKALLYDIDMDNEREVLILPYYVIDGYAVMQMPLNPASDGFVVGKYLVLVYEDRLDVYNGTSLIGEISYTVGPYWSLDHQCLVARNETHTIVITPDGIKSFTNPSLLVACYAGKIATAYMGANNTIIVNVDGLSRSVTGVAATPIALGFDGKYVYMLARGLYGTIFIQVDLATGMLQTSGLPIDIPPGSIKLFDIYTKEFIVVLGGTTYEVSSSIRVLSTTPVYKASRDYLVFLKGDGRSATIMSTIDYSIVKRVRVDDRIVDITYNPAVIVGAKHVYVEYGGPPITIAINVDKVVFAGDPVSYSVSVSGAYKYTVMVDGEPVNTTGVYYFDHAGVHNITVIATNGLVYVEKTVQVKVLPRPIDVDIEVVGNPGVYDLAVVRVKAIDYRSGKPAYTTCTVSYPGGVIHVKSWETFKLPILGEQMEVTVSCGGDGYYAVTNTTARISPYSSIKPLISVSYAGLLQLKIAALGPNNKLAPGKLIVYVDNKEYMGDNPLYIKLPGAGNYTIRIIFEPESPLYSRVTTIYNVTILKTSPQEAEKLNKTLGKVYIAMVEKNYTKTVTKYKVVTRTLKQGQSLGIVDLAMYIGAGAIIGGGAVAAAIMVSRYAAQKRLKKALEGE